MDSIFDFSSFIIQTINFTVVFLVLRSFIFKPYMKYLEEETTKRAQLELKLKESDSLLVEARREAEEIVDKARVDAKMMSAEIVENARKEGSEISARAQADADAARTKGFAQVDQERKAMTEELKTRVLDVALKLNEKLFGKNESNVEFLKKNANTVEF